MIIRPHRGLIAAAALLVALLESGRLQASEGLPPTVPGATAQPSPAPIPPPTPAATSDSAPTAGPEPTPAAGSVCPSCGLMMGENVRCCPTPGCPPPYCALPEYPPPTLYGRFRGMALKRDADEHVDFASLGIPAGADPPDIVLNTDSVEQSFSGGGEVLVGWMFAPRFGLEFSYFDLATYSESAVVRDETARGDGGSGMLFSPFGDFGAAPLAQFDYNYFAGVEYRSHLTNYELNLRYQLPMPHNGLRVSYLFGGRAMQINDDLEYLTASDITAPDITVNSILTRTRNHLLGLQAGGLFEFHVDPGWWINFGMKGAILHNKIDLFSGYVLQSGEDVAVFPHSREHGHTGFLGDLELSLAYEPGPHLSAEVGYRALWITGLALGAENFQSDPYLLMFGPPALNDDGQVVYHGPFAGVTVRW